MEPRNILLLAGDTILLGTLNSIAQKVDTRDPRTGPEHRYDFFGRSRVYCRGRNDKDKSGATRVGEAGLNKRHPHAKAYFAR